MEVDKVEDDIVQREFPVNAAAIFDALAGLLDDFMADGRENAPSQKRETP